MKAISLLQPWASLIAIGAKKIETRSWATKYRGPLVIHAAKKPFNTDSYFDRELYPFADALGLPNIFSFDTLPYGCIIATCNLVDCGKITDKGHTVGSSLAARIECGKYGGKVSIIEGREIFFGDYTPGRFAWMLEDIKMLKSPIPAKGHQSLWNWEPPGGELQYV